MTRTSTIEKHLKLILYFVLILLINIVGITLFIRADLTKDNIYSLSSASYDSVSNLSEPLTIKVFFSKDLPSPHNNTERYLKDLLSEYAAKQGKYFNYTFYNVTPEEDTLTQKSDQNRTMAKNYGIRPIQIRIMENDEIKLKNAYMGLVIIHGDLIEKIPAITSTQNLEYLLTTTIQKLNNKISALLRFNDKIKIKMFLSSSIYDIAPLINLNNLSELEKNVKAKIEQLNNKNHGILEFEHIDISEKKEIDILSKKHNLMALSWPAIPEKNITKGHGAAGLVIELKDRTTSLALINRLELPLIGATYNIVEPDDLEENLNSVIEKFIGTNKDIGILASHGSIPVLPNRTAMMQGMHSDGMQTLNNLISSRYSIKPIDLKTGTIPEGLNCLIIPRPTEKFSDYELFQIDQALMKGTNIAFFPDAFKSPQGQNSMGGQKFKPIDTGLEKLFTHYGISIKKAYVLDNKCYKRQSPVSQTQITEQKFYFAPLLEETTINNNPKFMQNIKGLVTIQIAPLFLEKQNIDKAKVKATKLLSSSDESWLLENVINLNPMFMSPPTDKKSMKSYDLSYVLDGSFTSFFKDKVMPKKDIGEKDIKEEENMENTENKKSKFDSIKAENTFLKTSKPAKLFLLASSQLLQDNMLDPEGRSTNSTFVLNIIDHLNNEDKIAVLRSKQQTLNPISPTTPFARTIIKTFNIAILPLSVILFGLGVLIKRTKRKQKIANRFNAKKQRS